MRVTSPGRAESKVETAQHVIIPQLIQYTVQGWESTGPVGTVWGFMLPTEPVRVRVRVREM